MSCTRNEFVSKFNQLSSENKLKHEFEIINFNDSPIIFVGKDKENNHIKIRIFENIHPNEFTTKIRQIINLYNSQFEFTTAPYPGQITTATNCGTKFRPIFSKNSGTNYIKYFANIRLGLSICDSDDYRYHQYLFFLKNGPNSIIAIDYYSNKSLDENDFYKTTHKLFDNPKLINYE